MAREHATGDIPDHRALCDDERALVGWMLEHGESNATSFLPQLEQASVSSRCASVNFSFGGKESSVSGMYILSDYVCEDADVHKLGAFVLARGGLLAGLALYSIEGAVTPTWLPKREQLHPLPV